MLNYSQDVTVFLKENFVPGNPDHPGVVKMTAGQLLEFLFQVFPKNCISDYELSDIMIALGYMRRPMLEENVTVEETKRKETHTINKNLILGWCLKSIDLDLGPEVRVIEKDR